MPCYASHPIPPSYFVRQRVKELDQALLAADQQYTALKCSLVDRKAVLSVEELQQVQASIYCTAANEWLIDTCVAAQSLSPASPSFLLQVELEPELVLLQLSLERQQAADVEELQRCIDEVQSHCTYLSTYLPTYLSTYLSIYLPTYLSTYLPISPLTSCWCMSAATATVVL